MEKLRELFIERLTKDMNPGEATAIFSSETGKALWSEITLDMILKAYDKTIEEYSL